LKEQSDDEAMAAKISIASTRAEACRTLNVGV
jgi:hypothetical protein